MCAESLCSLCVCFAADSDVQFLGNEYAVFFIIRFGVSVTLNDLIHHPDTTNLARALPRVPRANN